MSRHAMYEEWTPADATVDDDATPYWTWKRVIFLLIILITLIAFLIYTFSPIITTFINQLSPEPPLDLPGQRVQTFLLTISRPI